MREWAEQQARIFHHAAKHSWFLDPWDDAVSLLHSIAFKFEALAFGAK